MNKNLFIYLLIFTFIIPYKLLSKDIELKTPVTSWPPFIIPHDNTNKGIDIDVLNEIEKQTNIKFNYFTYPWNRSLILLEKGKADLITSLAKTKEREEYIKYSSIPYYTCSTVFYVHKGNKNKIKTYNDLNKYIIGYVDKSAYFEKFDKDNTLKKKAVTTEAKLLNMLKVGRIKVMIGTDCQVDYDIKKQNLVGKFEKTLFKPNNKVDLYIGMAKKSPLITEFPKIDKALKNLKEKSILKQIAREYYE